MPYLVDIASLITFISRSSLAFTVPIINQSVDSKLIITQDIL